MSVNRTIIQAHAKAYRSEKGDHTKASDTQSSLTRKIVALADVIEKLIQRGVLPGHPDHQSFHTGFPFPL
ncbi:MAG: hypothetical protein OXC62_17025 [Aestuariivita sp.]|nr:hypothetical protein [Aestuariivita sp.]